MRQRETVHILTARFCRKCWYWIQLSARRVKKRHSGHMGMVQHHAEAWKITPRLPADFSSKRGTVNEPGRFEKALLLCFTTHFSREIILSFYYESWGTNQYNVPKGQAMNYRCLHGFSKQI